jgi:hypothetical protein
MNNSTYNLKIKEDIVKPSSYFLLELQIDNNYYLLCKEKSLMVWETLEGLQQVIIRTGGVFKQFNPWPIRITAEAFPSIQDLDFNPVLLELTNKEYITEIPFLDMAGLVIIQVDNEKIESYRMIPR